MNKILFLIPDLRIGGGAQKVVSDLSIFLSEKYKTFILTYFHHKNLFSFKGKYCSLQENIGFFKKFLTVLKISTIIRPFKIFKIINAISPDIIISFMENANITAIITKLLFRINIPLISSVRCNFKSVYREEYRYMNFLIKVLFRLNSVNKIITVSKGIQDVLERDYGIQTIKLKTINNGINIQKIRKLAKNKIIGHSEIFRNNNITKYITIGRLSSVKGHKYLIEAFSKVKKEISNSKLIIIGDGPLKNDLLSHIKKKSLENDIILLGLKKNPYKYLINSDIFILSSKHEGFPHVLLEALACGLPIVSTNCETGPKEILENGRYGLLVDVLDSEDLAEKMIFLAKNEELMKQYSNLALKRVKYFDLKIIVNEWISLFESYL